MSKGHHPPNGIISTYFNYFQVGEIDYYTFAIYIYIYICIHVNEGYLGGAVGAINEYNYAKNLHQLACNPHPYNCMILYDCMVIYICIYIYNFT